MKYAMISQLQNPPPEFADVIKSHFYWKKQRILEVIIFYIWFKFSSVLKCNAIQYGKLICTRYNNFIKKNHVFQEVDSWVKKHNNKRLERAAQNLKQELKKLHQPPSTAS